MSDFEQSTAQSDSDLVAHSQVQSPRRSFSPFEPDEEDLAEITMLTAEIDEAEKFDLTFEVVNKELDVDEYATVDLPDSNIEEENNENDENIENEVTKMDNSLITFKHNASSANSFDLKSESEFVHRKRQSENNIGAKPPLKRLFRNK